MSLPSRTQAEKLLTEHVKDKYLLLHSHMVAGGLEAYAKKGNTDPDLWYITGLLHDLDYGEFPDEHPKRSLVWFTEWQYPEELIHAVEAHGTYSPRIEPKSSLAKTLIAVDELAGLLYAYSLMRPTGFNGMDAKGALKRFKDKAFAAKISREEIQYGVDQLGIDLKEHMQFLIDIYTNK
jgi:predicted hydrolase (HD superfamily)